MNLNKAQLIGRITRDPELKTLTNGTPVVRFGIATNYSFKGKDGIKKEQVQFHNCVIFGKRAEIFKEYVTKGQEMYVEGRIEHRAWEKDGVKKTATEIMVNDFQFGQRANKDNRETAQKSSYKKPAQEPEEDEDSVNIEDIPF